MLLIKKLIFTFAVVKLKTKKIEMDKTVKQVKLHGKYRRSLKHSHQVPWLNVNGLWLERAGFFIGQAIEIEVRSGLLIIKAV